MSRCKSCGAEIKWIKMNGTGKMMPVDAKPITYTDSLHPAESNALTLVTEHGTVTKARFDPGGDKVGYTSHFATCPNANAHRKDRR